MKIRCLRTRDELQTLAPRWNKLLQASASDGIFLTWEWVSNWWDIFGPRFNLLLLVAENEAGGLIGIAPTMTGLIRTRTGLNFRALMLIGQQGETMAEYLDFISVLGREQEITTALCTHLRAELSSEWDYIFFERILTTSPNLTVLREQFSAIQDGELKAPFTTLRNSWPEFLAAKSRNFRNQWNNSWNRLQTEGKVEFAFAGKDLPVTTALAEVARLHRERWADRSSSFGSENYLRFHERLCSSFHTNGWLVLLLLSVNDKNVAVRYDYNYADKLWCMQGGWSPEYAAKRVGTLLTGKVIEWGISHGLREYDFLGGDSDYKRRWADGEHVMVNLTARNPATLRGWLWERNRALETFAHWIKKMFRPKPKKADEKTATLA